MFSEGSLFFSVFGHALVRVLACACESVSVHL